MGREASRVAAGERREKGQRNTSNAFMKINENEQKVLEYLASDYEEGRAYYFSSIEEETKLDKKVVRCACRPLARKGLAELVRGLFDDDGKVAGSGYSATLQGAQSVNHCDLCNELPCYEYDGKKECDAHYRKSVKSTVQPLLP
jgi:hypothetical protein